MSNDFLKIYFPFIAALLVALGINLISLLLFNQTVCLIILAVSLSLDIVFMVLWTAKIEDDQDRELDEYFKRQRLSKEKKRKRNKK